jgi:sterol 24-C-methyltransferase
VGGALDRGTAQDLVFLASGGIELGHNSHVADLGSGDGLIAAGLARLSGAQVTGFDLSPTDNDSLTRAAHAHGEHIADLRLEFRTSTEDRLPADDRSFDEAITWSVAEHVKDLRAFFYEAWRVIKPYGHLYVQAWPLWASEHGHDLPHWLAPWLIFA